MSYKDVPELKIKVLFSQLLRCKFLKALISSHARWHKSQILPIQFQKPLTSACAFIVQNTFKL